MSELLSLLSAASSCLDPNFNEAQKKIIERSESNPLAFVRELLEILQNQQLITTPTHVFIILNVITNCYRISSEEEPVEPEISAVLIELSMSYFPDPNEQTRLAAVNLFNVITEIQILLIPQLELINKLADLLASENIPNILSATECLANIAKGYVLGKDTQLKLVEVLIHLLENFGENIDVISHVITIFTHISASIFEFFEESYAESFIESVISHLSEEKLKAVIYNFIYSVVTDKFSAIVAHIPTILPHTISDLMSDTPSNVKLAAAFCWEGVFADNTLSEEEVMGEAVVTLAPALIACMRHDIIGEPSLTDWEPYTAAFSTLRQILNKKNPGYAEILHPFLIEQITAGYTEEADQVVSARCLLLIADTVRRFPDIFEDTLAYIYQMLESTQSVHVVFFTLIALAVLLSFSITCEPYLDHLELLLSYSTEEIIGNKALDCINRIIIKNDFTNFEIYASLHELLSAVPAQNVYGVLKCFTSARCIHVPSATACEILQLLFTMLKETEDSNIADYICYCIKPILLRGIPEAGELFESAYPILLRWYSAEVFQAMTTIATFAFSSPECIVPYSEEFLHLVLEALQSDCTEAWIEGANAWSFMYGRIDYSELAGDLCEQILEKADPKAPMPLQEIALYSFSFIFNMIKSDIEATPINSALSRYTDDEELVSLEMSDREKFTDIASILLSLSCQMARADALQVTSAVVDAILNLRDMHDPLRDSFLQIAEIYDQKAESHKCINASLVSQKIHEIFDQPEE